MIARTPPGPRIFREYSDGRPEKYSIPAADVPAAEFYTTDGGNDRIRILDTGKIYAIEGTPEDDIRQAVELIGVSIAHMRYDLSERGKTIKLNKRRDELARKFTYPHTGYADANEPLQHAIDHIIGLESAHD